MKKRTEYFRGPTDFNPTGDRKKAFDHAYDQYLKGRVVLLQKRYGYGDYGYIMEAK
jgi:hypothetical protein